ncbi:hypothetical protein M5K25_027220 [Dendrobium thyrsiflorum]|uniref:Uncharacterized protein n=1 Tax=Dendrobium thyrsiflorum TaxID=117978 RepID=A0ABD0TZD7_DENTH
MEMGNYLVGMIASGVDGAVENDVSHVRDCAQDVEKELRAVAALNVDDGITPFHPVLNGNGWLAGGHGSLVVAIGEHQLMYAAIGVCATEDVGG